MSARPGTALPETTEKKEKLEEEDPELKRAKDLVALHYEVREKQKRGELGRGLQEARAMVERAG